MCSFLVQLDSGQFQEQSQEYQRWKEWRDKVAGELRQSVSLGRRLLPDDTVEIEICEGPDTKTFSTGRIFTDIGGLNHDHDVM